MAFDPDLADRIRELTATESGLDERRMFGGLAFLVNGNMAVAATREGGLMVRVSRRRRREPAATRSRRADGDGRPRDAGWLRIAGPGIKTRRQLQSWVTRGIDFARGCRPSSFRRGR